MANEQIRQEIKKNGLKHWKIASVMGISENTLVRWLRVELDDEKKAAVLNAIKRLKE